MSEFKDPAIKLFGKTIPLPEASAASGLESTGGILSAATTATISRGEKSCNTGREHADAEISADQDQGEISQKVTEADQKDGDLPLISDESVNPHATSGTNENPDNSYVGSQTETLSSEKNEEEKSETDASQEKTLKKPDKILPCPRCNNMDTKFCYYNNYNVNQPRHFCKNCQRYWTAGGTMRNVHVGAGRRKKKNSTSHCRYITVTEALQNGRTEVPNGFHHTSVKASGTVLTFGMDAPLCESMASVLKLSEKKMQNGTKKGFQRPEELKIHVPCGDGETWDDNLNGSPVKAVNLGDEEKGTTLTPVMQSCQAFPPQIPCFPGAAWPYPWNSAQWTPLLPPPAFCPPGFPMPFYPTPAYWGCTVPGTWNIPWVPQPTSQPNHMGQNSGPISPLGKHSRDGNMVAVTNSKEEQSKENGSEKCLWIPKTIRIDDHEDAAKSSTWATLGIKNDNNDSVCGGKLFKAFSSEADEKSRVSESSPILHANPAALSRSLDFHERS